MSAAPNDQPLVGAGPVDGGSASPPSSEQDTSETQDGTTGNSESKFGSKRRLFALGKKKEGETIDKMDDSPAGVGAAAVAPTSSPRNAASAKPTSSSHAPLPEPLQLGASPQRSPRGPSAMASPGQRYRSSSPRIHSPASSQIFERNVQDSTLPGELSPAIPSHIQTEDHIPPVLEASSLAITDDHLNPDEVEIVMHSAHQPAAAVVTGTSSLHESLLASPVFPDDSLHAETEESTSNYGSLDTTDPRRLSFISFADVVQAEHAESNRDALHMMSLSSTTANRSPSPIRSPASSHGLSASPPTSGATSVKGADATSTKVPRTPSSPTVTVPGTHSPPLGGGELTIETMRQALRKTGSGDLSGFRSQPLSAVSLEENALDRPPFR